MLAILQYWIVALIVCVSLGDFVLHILSKLYREEADPSYKFLWQFLIGLATITFLANVTSLFFRINAEFYCLAIILSVFWLIKNRSRIVHIRPYLFDPLTRSPLLSFLYVVLVLITAHQCCLLTDNVDQWGYYLPLVRWIENYPLIPGLANLNARFGFNSAYHMSHAIFSQTFIFRDGIYALTGLLYLIFSFQIFKTIKEWWVTKQELHPEQFLFLSAFVFPFFFLINSMDADYPTIFIGVFLISVCIKRIRLQQIWKMDVEFWSYVLLALYLFTVRPFSIFYLLYPLIFLVRGIRTIPHKELIVLILLPLIYVLPWLVRNYIMSGYLIFPLYFMDFLDADWKVSELMTKNSYLIIKEFAKLELIRHEYDYMGVTSPAFMTWIGPWLENNFSLLIGKIVILGLPLTFIASALLVFKKKISRPHKGLIVVLSLIVVLWFYNYPSIRFGWAYILSLMILCFYLGISPYKSIVKLSTYILIALLFISYARSGIRVIKSYNKECLISPMELPRPETQPTTKDGISIKRSSSHYCYGISPPCIPSHHNQVIEPRGQAITDGFRTKKNQ